MYKKPGQGRRQSTPLSVSEAPNARPGLVTRTFVPGGKIYSAIRLKSTRYYSAKYDV